MMFPLRERERRREEDGDGDGVRERERKAGVEGGREARGEERGMVRMRGLGGGERVRVRVREEGGVRVRWRMESWVGEESAAASPSG